MCVLRVSGKHFDPRAWVEDTALDVIGVHAPGESLFERAAARGKPRSPAFHANVSRKSWSDWEGQVEDAVSFLTEHRAELERLGRQPDVECIHIDFPVDAWPDAQLMHREVILPVALLRAAADAGVEVIVTVYVNADDDDEDNSGDQDEGDS